MGNIKSNHSFVDIDFEYSIGMRIKEGASTFTYAELTRIIHKPLLSWGGDVWSSPSIAGQERENERVSFEKGDGLKNPPLLSVNSPPDSLS